MNERIRPILWAGVLTVAVVSGCSVLDRVAGGDVMVPLELGAALVFGTWAIAVARTAWRAARLGRELAGRSYATAIAGVPCRVLPGGRSAFVLGTIRPRIYVGDLLIALLSEEEMEGVLAHEDHHRRTAAPLRSAALEAWAGLLSWSTAATAVLGNRLVDLERSADAYALRRGVSRRVLAAALLHADGVRSPIGTNFSSHADQRVVALLSSPAASSRTVALEWLPSAVAAAAAILCHAALWAAIQ